MAVKAGLGRACFVLILAEPRQRDERHGAAEFGPDASARLVAIDVRHPDVDKHHARMKLANQVEAVLSVVRRPAFAAEFFDDVLDSAAADTDASANVETANMARNFFINFSSSDAWARDELHYVE